MGAYENSPKEQGLYSEFNLMHLSSNRQDDTSQHVTSSPQKQLEKARRKAETKNNWYAEATTQSGSQSIAIHSSKVITKTSLDQAGMIQQLAQLKIKRKQSLSKKPIKRLTKKIITNHYKRVFLIKHVNISNLS